MITLERVRKPTIEIMYLLLNASYYTDDTDLFELVRLSVTDPEHYRIYKAENGNLLGACLVRIQRPIFYIWLMAGDGVHNWYNDISSMLDKEAVELGCTKMKSYGRLGWLKKPPTGWKPKAVELVRDLLVRTV